MSKVKTCLRQGRFDELHAWLVDGFSGPPIGHFSVAVWQDGILSLLPGNGGRASPVFPLGCLQDAMIGTLFCTLVDKGGLSFDDPIGNHVPELLAPTSGEGVPRIRDLLSHSTGLWGNRSNSTNKDPSDWPAFVQILAPAVPRFTPGTLAVHSLLDRIILLQVAERALGRSAYAELRDRFARPSGTFALRRPDGPLAHCYSELHGSLADCASSLDYALATSWFDRVRSGEVMRPITQAATVRPWAPVADGLGLFRLANGIFGQDGDHPALGFVGIRLSPSCRSAVIGHFRTSPERDHVLNRIASDVMNVPPPPKSAVLGDLNGFEPEALTGTYSGISGQRFYVEAVDGQVRMAASLEMGAVPADIREDGALTGRWAAPNLWIEPQSLGRADLIGFRFGKHLYLKKKHDTRLLSDP